MLNARPIRGRFRQLRSAANLALVAILFATPWIRIGGEPLVLLDIAARKFHVFGLVIFPQELFFLWLLVAGLALALFFFTALFGRIWCGWSCPQTVFTDIFAGVARRIEGWRGHTPPRHVALWRKVLTHLVFIALSALIGFHLVSYFRSPYQLIEGALQGSFYPTVLSWHVAIAVLAYLDFTFVRQYFCRFLCPYARFQGVLFDKDTLVIGYDTARGEPRGKRGSVAGDCVDCGLCVAVCPSEIDIRDGLQLDCIACTQCIDACNGVMSKLDREPDLISYRPLAVLEGGTARVLRPRVVVYGALLLAVAVGFVAVLQQRQPMALHVARNRDALYTRTADGRVGNSFVLQVENRDRAERSFHIRLEESDRFELIAGVNPIPVPAIDHVEARVFVVAHAETDPGERFQTIRFVLEPTDDATHRIVRESRFVNPGNGDGS